MGDNKVLFQFGLKEALDKVLLLGSWYFDKYLLILHKLGVSGDKSTVQQSILLGTNPWSSYHVPDKGCRSIDRWDLGDGGKGGCG